MIVSWQLLVYAFRTGLALAQEAGGADPAPFPSAYQLALLCFSLEDAFSGLVHDRILAACALCFLPGQVPAWTRRHFPRRHGAQGINCQEKVSSLRHFRDEHGR